MGRLLRCALPCLWASALLAGCAEPVEPPPEPPLEELSPSPLAFPPEPGSTLAQSDSWYAGCGPQMTFSMAELLPSIAFAMARQQIPYGRASPDEWRDCSGNFLRLSSYLAQACPAGQPELPAPPGIRDYAAKERNAVELQPQARSSRDLARWYHEQGRFVPVWYEDDEPAAVTVERYRHLLKPGAVLWFSSKPPREEHGLDQLFSRNLRGTHIRHMGTVVEIELDEDGLALRYSMYHGRNPGHPATVTEHPLETTGGRPPFGNGDDYLVAIGALLPLAMPPELHEHGVAEGSAP